MISYFLPSICILMAARFSNLDTGAFPSKLQRWASDPDGQRSFGFPASFRLSYRVFQTCAFAEASPETQNPRCPSLHLFCQCSKNLSIGGAMPMRLFFDSKHCKRADLNGGWLQFALVLGPRHARRLKLGRSGSSGPTTLYHGRMAVEKGR